MFKYTACYSVAAVCCAGAFVNTQDNGPSYHMQQTPATKLHCLYLQEHPAALHHREKERGERMKNNFCLK